MNTRADVKVCAVRKILRAENVYASRASYSQFTEIVANFSERQIGKGERYVWIADKMMVGGGDVLWLANNGWVR